MTCINYNFPPLIILLLIILNPNSAKQKLANKNSLYYNEDDRITLFRYNTFQKEFYNQNFTWIVEYYQNACDYCSDFAATWKYLAKDLESWNDTLKFAVVDCSVEVKILLCKKLQKTTQPLVVYYHENFMENVGEQGDNIQVDYDAKNLKRFIIQHIISEQKAGRARIFPDLIPFTDGKLKNLFVGFPTGINLDKDVVILLFEYEKNSFGAELIMEFHRNPNVKIRYCHTNNRNLTDTFGVKKLPTLVLIKTNRSYQKFHHGFESKGKIKKFVLNALHKKIYNLQKKTKKTKENIIFKRLSQKQQPSGQIIEEKVKKRKRTTNPVQEYLLSYRKQIIKNRIKNMRDPLFQTDMATALKLSFKNEIASQLIITGQKYYLLLNYTRIILKYFPLTKRGHHFMMDFRDIVRRHQKSLHGARIKDLFQKHGDVFKSDDEWLACDRDDSAYGKYTCGLWKLFHFLTVRAAEMDKAKVDFDFVEILTTFIGYVRYFMKCDDCAQKLHLILEDQSIEEVTSFDSAILWLWTVHNIVNDKLSKDLVKLHAVNVDEMSKIVEYPKVQFPSPHKCSNCRNVDNTWNVNAVLNYIKFVYSNHSQQYKKHYLSKNIGEITINELLASSASTLLYLLMIIDCGIVSYGSETLLWIS